MKEKAIVRGKCSSYLVSSSERNQLIAKKGLLFGKGLHRSQLHSGRCQNTLPWCQTWDHKHLFSDLLVC